MSRKFTKDTAHAIIDSLNSTVTEVSFNDFELQKGHSSKTTVTYKGDHITSLTEEQLTAETLLEFHNISTQFNTGDDVDEKLEWSVDQSATELQAWKTEIDENKVTIDVINHYLDESFNVTAPIEDPQEQRYNDFSSNEDVATDGKTFQTLENAFVYCVWYMNQYHPHKVDQAVRTEEVAKERFMDVPGIGEQKAEEAVDQYHIRTFEGLDGSVSKIVSRNYTSDAQKTVEAKLNSGGETTNDSRVRELTSIILAENI